MAAARVLMMSSCWSPYSAHPTRDLPTRSIIPSGRPCFSNRRKTYTRLLLLAQASPSDPQAEEDETAKDKNGNNPFSSPEDLNYLWKLGAGSAGGAAVIKYGSILFPEITRPNILQALIMISMPVIVAVLLLIRQSRIEGQNEEPFQ